MSDTRAKENTNWGRWGDGDEIGALNLITAERRHRALGTPRTGKLYSLGLPVRSDTLPPVPYRVPSQRVTLTNQADMPMWNAIGEQMGVPSPGTGANEDVFITSTHNGTHMDALCHVFHEGKMYNGFPADSASTLAGSHFDGIEKIDGIAGRAVLLDVAAHVGVPWLEPRTRIDSDLLEATRQAQGTTVETGDILLVRTGWMDFALSGERADESYYGGYGQAGLGLGAVDFIDSHDLAVVGADNSAVECLPCDERYQSVHVELLVRRGIHLLEHLDLRALAADRVHEFFFVAAPLRIVGGSGSPINPIAIA
ncbi:cyclase family protein [Rhodococcus sp. SORGH_AS_0301]|uniref:cyclase family protein n=1 Tax=Rhodococcus sp. SORGH_AS_0301 TaxID=3041780 RepID=UPI002784FA9A|nr:cyclase family protein [Rhodococcus sp. SORGH_AS_0301]MDQ1178584.1 kynurenine formamidase [Rhodococcus sp. SORGH_AS_0301]